MNLRRHNPYHDRYSILYFIKLYTQTLTADASLVRKRYPQIKARTPLILKRHRIRTVTPE